MTIRTPSSAAAADPLPPRLVERAELALVAAAVAQAVLVGAWLALFPDMALRFGGFPPAPPFFVRWVGLLQVVLAVGYALEWLRFRRVALLVVAKGATTLFLAATWIVAGLPTLMLVATLIEGLMASGAAALQGPADRARRSRIKLKLVTPPPRAAPAPTPGQAPVRRS